VELFLRVGYCPRSYLRAKIVRCPESPGAPTNETPEQKNASSRPTSRCLKAAYNALKRDALGLLGTTD
jgi:hypothetical protein